MTYRVDVEGNLKIIKTPPQKLLTNWENFKISKNQNGTVHIELHNRTPYYPDVVAELFVLSHFYKGKLSGKGEDNEPYDIELPIQNDDIIRASERNQWKPDFQIHQQKYKEDRFLSELERIGFQELYPEWLKKISKNWFGRLVEEQ